ncbi:hypothetical protein NZNM25_03010 [Nitrosopumilus zosterae]|uniref:RNA polymerase sigma factor 70 region 4 type 2 domain-containing protein n=1 Tax=Nitrosopumilus zosterae TaxID=718286 RepID=A0A2S2KPB0_9ARCH|nr:hypothetical protein [Nitrosopumilus zosterae]BDQ31300.1 hypothetical protein NZOSNM25_001413 [Nitrosopumilus zosterae]GBH33510.1 hypothetical protein NZNM25_03010 [Nitrosopumilus zosterae]
MNDKALESIDNRLKIISKLLALDVVKGRQFQEQVKILHEMGMQPSEIADCLGKTANNVRVAVHGIKKKSTQKEVKEQ